jgi:hypothetical protein
MSNSVHLSDMSRVPDQRCFRPFRNRQSAARSVLPNWQLPLTGRLVTTSRAHTRGEPPVPASIFVYVTATASSLSDLTVWRNFQLMRCHML